MAKAKRLIQSGQVQLGRNGYNYIVGTVQGDHGSYDTELSRDDPNSRAITGWQCTCPWDQYAWQRTRKWKKFEGRPCAHVLALYWKALSTPMDEDLSPEQAEAMGTGQKLPAEPVAEHSPDREPGMNETPEGKKVNPEEGKDLPRSFSPEGEIVQGDQMPIEGVGGPPGPAQAPLAAPPGGAPNGPQPSGILPEFQPPVPPEPWKGPGTTPGGQESPPGAFTQPGAKQPGPANPLQLQMTYSKTSDFQPQQVVRLKNDAMGIAEGPEQGLYGDGEYREVPAGTLGEVRDQEPSTGWIEVIFPLDDSGPHEPFHVKMFLNASDIEPTNQTNAFIKRQGSVDSEGGDRYNSGMHLGASLVADVIDATLDRLRRKYAGQLDGQGHQLWFRPNLRTRAEGEYGRGMIHDPTGTVHTWPESEATHADMIALNNFRDQDCMRFYLEPDGQVGDIYGPSSRVMDIARADPALARANGLDSYV